ncbi:MAG TPA: PilZ domain-containing protein [Azospirillaceae bacterium]|nr:PilZ domain-containing protein [Azospirillaceae bacterium]
MSLKNLILRFLPGNPANRRAFERQPVNTCVSLTLAGRTMECTISDVSPRGAFLSPMADEIKVGTEGVLEVPDSPVRAEFRIVRRTPSGVGVEFLRDGVGAIVAGWTKARTADVPGPAAAEPG